MFYIEVIFVMYVGMMNDKSNDNTYYRYIPILKDRNFGSLNNM